MFDPLLTPARPAGPPLAGPTIERPSGPPQFSAPGAPPQPGSPPSARPTVPMAPDGRTYARRNRRRLVAATGIALIAVTAGAAGGFVAGSAASDDVSEAVASAPVAVPTASATGAGTIDVKAVIAAVEPSVVSISTQVVERRGPFEMEGEGAGSGIVLDSTGRILTNAHVVSGASEVVVTVGGEDRAATVVGSDERNDIAVLQLDDASGVTPAELADTDAVAVGDPVVAIGNALGLDGGPTVTQGIVSALDRSIDTMQGSLTGLLQTDAAISSGNSGGPLVDAAGEVIGINTAVAASGNGVEASNVGFAIAIDDALAIANDLI